jgi:hypothetical protein
MPKWDSNPRSQRWSRRRQFLPSTARPLLSALPFLSPCYFMAPFLMRERICNLLLLLCLTRAVPLGSESRGTQDHILLSHFLRLLNLEGQIPIFISPSDGGVHLYSRALGSLSVASYDSQGYGGDILTRLHTGLLLLSKSKPDRQTVSQPASQPASQPVCQDFEPTLELVNRY